MNSLYNNRIFLFIFLFLFFVCSCESTPNVKKSFPDKKISIIINNGAKNDMSEGIQIRYQQVGSRLKGYLQDVINHYKLKVNFLVKEDEFIPEDKNLLLIINILTYHKGFNAPFVSSAWELEAQYKLFDANKKLLKSNILPTKSRRGWTHCTKDIALRVFRDIEEFLEN